MFILDSAGDARIADAIPERRSHGMTFNVFVTSPNHFSLGRVAERDKQMYNLP